MYCRVFQYQFRPGKETAVRDLASTAKEIMQRQPGFVSVTFFADEAQGVAGALSVWQSREAIEAYIRGSSGLFRVASAGLILGSPQSLVAEVIGVD